MPQEIIEEKAAAGEEPEAVEDEIVLVSQGKYIFATAERHGHKVAERVPRQCMQLADEVKTVYFKEIASALKRKLDRACRTPIQKK
jgi:hypothetical protein